MMPALSATKPLRLLTDAFLAGLILLGVVFRFAWGNWSQGANLHPDEYGLTNTLTQLRLPESIDEYFNTRLSPLSPYRRYDLAGAPLADGPDNALPWGQWPITLIRFTGELTGNTGYDEIRLVGRSLSALADVLSLLLIYLIGRRLYGPRTGLLAAALSALAVMQIQQSHFMTVDNFSVTFTVLAVYACVRIAGCPGLSRSPRTPDGNGGVYRPSCRALGWYLLFGVAYGLALASKINLLPLGGILLVAGFMGIADLRLKSRRDLARIFAAWVLLSALAGLAAVLTFRLAQPMSFRSPAGDTGFWTFELNPDWLDNMRIARLGSNGVGGGPPGEQWAHRPAIVFPWVNMVLWGMGLPLGLMSWAGFLWAGWRTLRTRGSWRAHLIPLVWTGGYFLFMATRWVKSIRYFLPVYPFLALFAAWGLVELWRWAAHSQNRRAESTGKDPIRSNHPARSSLALAVSLVVVLGTAVWAGAFVRAVYAAGHTRVQATEWIYQNIPGPFHLELLDAAGDLHYEPVSAPDRRTINAGMPFFQSFIPRADGRLSAVILPHAAAPYGLARLRVVIATDPFGDHPLDEAWITVDSPDLPGGRVQGSFHQAELQAGQEYYLVASVPGQADAPDAPAVTISRAVIANETWDEGLPFPFDHRDPFGQLYRGLPMEVRWYDDQNKRQMFLDTLAQADYLVLPSQRAIWTTCRIPRTYPMTMDYYRALFGGQLGYEQVAFFSAPIRLGPLQVSDVGGTLAWGEAPSLPLFNSSLLAAEEAFSVYDHPPVWIFEKRADYSQAEVEAYFNAIDLSQVVVEAPRDASLPPCR